MINCNCDLRIKSLQTVLLTSFSHCILVTMPRLSNDERNQALGMVRCGRSVRQIARAMNCHPSTISRLLQRLEETGSVKDRPRPGQPRKTSNADDRSINLRMLRNRTVTAKRLQQDLRQERQVRVSTDTIRRRLRSSGFRAFRPYRALSSPLHTKRRDWLGPGSIRDSPRCSGTESL